MISASERRGALAVLALALLVSGWGMWLRNRSSGVVPTPITDSIQVLEPQASSSIPVNDSDLRADLESPPVKSHSRKPKGRSKNIKAVPPRDLFADTIPVIGRQ